jgi:hypothetical protein
MMMRRILLMVVAFVVVVAAAACGGDDAGGVEVPTKVEWIAAADAICAEDNAELALIPEPQTPEEMGEAGVRATEIQRTGLAEVRALARPEGDEAAIEEILDAVEAVLDWGAEFTEAFAAGDEAKAGELHAEGERLTEEAIRLAKDYGLQECLEPEE